MCASDSVSEILISALINRYCCLHVAPVQFMNAGCSQLQIWLPMALRRKKINMSSNSESSKTLRLQFAFLTESIMCVLYIQSVMLCSKQVLTFHIISCRTSPHSCCMNTNSFWLLWFQAQTLMVCICCIYFQNV